MAYYIDAENVSLNKLRERIQNTDLVPSRVSLLENLDAKMKLLEQQGITTLATLRIALKTSKRLDELSKLTVIDRQYLVLLRREIESYFPKPRPLSAFDWLPREELKKLEEVEIDNTFLLYESTTEKASKVEILAITNVDGALLDSLITLSDLTRIQWVSPKFAGMLVAATYDTVTKIAEANAEELHAALERINSDKQYFKGKIGLRDIKRVVQAAKFVSV